MPVHSLSSLRTTCSFDVLCMLCHVLHAVQCSALLCCLIGEYLVFPLAESQPFKTVLQFCEQLALAADRFAAFYDLCAIR